MSGVLLWILLFQIISTISGQFELDDCPMVQESELGDIAAFSNTGLLSDALAVQTGDGTIGYQLLEYNTVCLGQGSVRGTYRSTSIVVRYLAAGGAESTGQMHLQCVSGEWNIDNFANIVTAITDADGSLTTALRRDCFLCLAPAIALTQPGYSTEEHCLGKATVNDNSLHGSCLKGIMLENND